jgi:MoxR-like ATPase
MSANVDDTSRAAGNGDGLDLDGLDLARAAAVVDGAVAAARAGLVDRELIAEVTVLCAVAGEHLLVIGPPGTGKSEAVRRVAGQLGGGYFEYLLGRFTEPG